MSRFDLAATVAAKLRRRHLIMPAVLTAHGGLLAILLFAAAPPAAERAGAARISTFDVAAADRPAAPQPPVREPELEHPEPLVKLASLSLIDVAPPLPAIAADAEGLGAGCSLEADLARAFAETPLLAAQLARIGPEARSVANAIMFWDGGWTPVDAEAPADAVDFLRHAVVEGVRAAPAECLEQEIVGPRFIAVSGEEATTVLVLGSGSWRWAQLLETPAKTNDTAREAIFGSLAAAAPLRHAEMTFEPRQAGNSGRTQGDSE